MKINQWEPPVSDLEFLFASLVGQGQASETLISARIATAFYNDVLQIELPCALGIKASDYACRPRVKWLANDYVKFYTGLDIFSGKKSGYLGRLGKNDLLMLGIDIQF